MQYSARPLLNMQTKVDMKHLTLLHSSMFSYHTRHKCVSVRTEKSFRNIIKSNRNQSVFSIFRFIWNQADVRLVQAFKSERIVQDLKYHQIFEFGQLWRLPEGEQCNIESSSLKYKLFKISFLKTFISIKTLNHQI